MVPIPQEIERLYQQLELIDSISRWELIKQLKPLSEIHTGHWKDVLINEKIAIQFCLIDGDLKPEYSGVDANGKEVGFPMVSDFSANAKEYLIERIQSTQNHFLLARYNHILFEIDKKQQYAIVAINAYKQILSLKLQNKTKERISDSVNAILRLTEKTKKNVVQIKEYLLDVVLKSDLSIYDKFYITKDLLKSKIYKSYEFKFLPELSLEWIKRTLPRDYFIIKEILETVIKICNNNDIEPSIYYEKLAENEDILWEEHPEESDFIRPLIFARKMEYYKNSKNQTLFEKASKDYADSKSKVELPLVNVPYDEDDIDQVNAEINESVKRMMTWEPERILNYFVNDSPLFPNFEEIIKDAKTNREVNFLSTFSTTRFDINVNTKNLNEQDELDGFVHRAFIINLGINLLPTFMRVLSNGVINGKLSYNHIYSFLAKHTWFGQDFSKMKMRTDPGGRNSYNWLSLLAPSLHSLFSQIEACVLLKNNIAFNNWILCTDSLTLKFEGALRDLLRLTGFGTSKVKNDETQEMLLEDLLNSDFAKKLFTENDLVLFKVVFTGKGDNLRNNVAHCFYHTDDYSFDKICKVFFCILRLGKYRLKKHNDDIQSELGDLPN
jgi:hypothetical protein